MILLKNQRSQRNLDDEQRFQTAVLKDNLSLEDQEEYRKQQIKRAVGDREEQRRLRLEVSSIKDQIEVRNYSDEWLTKLTNFNTGTSSIDKTISWLEKKLSKTTDQAIKKNLETNLATLRQQKFTLQQNTLNEQTTYAVNDKSDKVLNTAIKRVSDARKEALLAGNDNYVAVLDLQLQNLKKTQAETQVTKALTDMSVGAIAGQTAVDLLNVFDDKIAKSDTKSGVTIGGIPYDSLREFWNTKRIEYLNDRTTNGFFGRYKDELGAQIDYKSSKGILTNDSLGEVSKAYDDLSTRPEMKEYIEKINQEKQTTISKAADAKATEILNKFTVDLDASKAVAGLSGLQSTYGVDQTLNFQKIILKASQEKTDQLNSLLQATAQIANDNPGMTYEQAFTKAVQSGVATSSTYSPEALAGKPVEELGSESVKGTNKGPSLDVATFAEGDLVKTKDSATVYRSENGVLRPFSGNFSDDLFKQTTGKTFADVKTVPNLGMAIIGQAISAPQITPISQPGPNPPPAQPAQPNVAAPARKPVTDVVGRRKSTVNPNVYEYYRKDNSQGFGQEGALFSYLQSSGYNDIKNFKQLDPFYQ